MRRGDPCQQLSVIFHFYNKNHNAFIAAYIIFQEKKTRINVEAQYKKNITCADTDSKTIKSIVFADDQTSRKVHTSYFHLHI